MVRAKCKRYRRCGNEGVNLLVYALHALYMCRECDDSHRTLKEGGRKERIVMKAGEREEES